jgi:hypothetical protein
MDRMPADSGPLKRAQDDRARLTTFAAVLVWLLWAANAVSDLLRQGQLAPFTLVMLAALLGGQILVWLRVVPRPMPRRWALVTYAIVGIMVLGFAGYSVAGLLFRR